MTVNPTQQDRKNGALDRSVRDARILQPFVEFLSGSDRFSTSVGNTVVGDGVAKSTGARPGGTRGAGVNPARPRCNRPTGVSPGCDMVFPRTDYRHHAQNVAWRACESRFSLPPFQPRNARTGSKLGTPDCGTGKVVL